MTKKKDNPIDPRVSGARGGKAHEGVAYGYGKDSRAIVRRSLENGLPEVIGENTPPNYKIAAKLLTELETLNGIEYIAGTEKILNQSYGTPKQVVENTNTEIKLSASEKKKLLREMLDEDN